MVYCFSYKTSLTWSFNFNDINLRQNQNKKDNKIQKIKIKTTIKKNLSRGRLKT